MVLRVADVREVVLVVIMSEFAVMGTLVEVIVLVSAGAVDGGGGVGDYERYGGCGVGGD